MCGSGVSTGTLIILVQDGCSSAVAFLTLKSGCKLVTCTAPTRMSKTSTSASVFAEVSKILSPGLSPLIKERGVRIEIVHWIISVEFWQSCASLFESNDCMNLMISC